MLRAISNEQWLEITNNMEKQVMYMYALVAIISSTGNKFTDFYWRLRVLFNKLPLFFITTFHGISIKWPANCNVSVGAAENFDMYTF